MNGIIKNADSEGLKQKAEISIQKAKEIILQSIPHDEIVSIYVKGSFVRDELVPDSDVDVVVILKSEQHLPLVYELAKQHENSTNPPIQIVAYTMNELETGERATNRTKNTTAVSRFVKHLDSLLLIYGAKPEGKLFTRTNEKDLSIGINNFKTLFVPDYKKGTFSFKDLVKQVLWLTENELKVKGLELEYSWQKLADSVHDQNHIVHLALKYRRQSDISEEEKEEFLRKIDEYLNRLETIRREA
jgi:predicted nucleotidyltransferase